MGLLGLTLGMLQFSFSRPPRAEIQLSVIVLFVTAFVGSHGFRMLIPWLEARCHGWRMLAGLIALVALLSAVLGTVLHTIAPFWLGESGGPPPLPWITLQYGFLLGSWVTVHQAVRFYRRDRAASEVRLRLESARRDAELRALKSRINPHFLFNSLNTLRALIPRDLERPRTAVTLLADLMRASLRVEHQDLVPFAQEMETVDNYLALEKLRLGDRLRVEREIDAVAGVWPVPPFLVQGLVENAIRHGVGRRESGGVVKISGRVVDGSLCVRISNPGELPADGPAGGRSLDQARTQLALLWGEAARLDVRSIESGEVVAELILPPRSAKRRSGA